MELIVVKPPVNFNPSLLNIYYDGELQGRHLEFELREVKLKKGRDEIRLARRLYRKEYMSRPEVKAKIKKRLENPKVIEARRHYAEDPKVKERKKFLSKRARELRNLLKKENPVLYNQYLDRITPIITPDDFMNPPLEFHCGTCDQDIDKIDHFKGKVNVFPN